MKKNSTFSLIKFAPDKNLAIALGAAVLSVLASTLFPRHCKMDRLCYIFGRLGFINRSCDSAQRIRKH